MDTIIVISIAGMLTLVAVVTLRVLCGCAEKSSSENASKIWSLRLRLRLKKRNKHGVSDTEDGGCTCIRYRVATKNDKNCRPILLTSVQSTSDDDHVIHTEGPGKGVHDEVISKSDDPALMTDAQLTSSMDPVVLRIEDDTNVSSPFVTVVAEVMHHPVQYVRGLKNLGNTCYFNSTMQALVHTNSAFREELEKVQLNGKFVSEVLNFFSSMQTDNSRQPYSPYALHHLFGKKSPRFADKRQHDSHECLRNFLDNIRKEERDNSGAVDKRKVLTVVDSVFGGHFITVYICEDCETPYHVFEALLDISLPIMIDDEDLDAMNSARGKRQKKTVKPQMKLNASQSKKSKKHKLIILPLEPDCKSTTMEDGSGQKNMKRKRYNISNVTLQLKTADKQKSETENSVTEIQPAIIHVQPKAEDDDAEEETVGAGTCKAEVECDKHSVSSVAVEKVKENSEQEKDSKQAQQTDDKVTDDLVKEDFDSYRVAIHKLMMEMTPLSLSSPYLPNDKAATRKHVTIHDCFSYFTREEHITKEYLCNDCYARHPPNEGEDPLLTSATKHTLIFNPPAILTLHLKRFELKEGGSVKRNDMIIYEERLDIAPYCSSMCRRKDPPRPNIWYSLYGVVVHHGSTLKSGHYTAYVKIRDRESDAGFRKLLQKNFFDRDVTRERLIEMMQEKHSDMTHRPTRKQPTGTWYCMDDSSCRKVSVTTVLNQEAYLLFYERMS